MIDPRFRFLFLLLLICGHTSVKSQFSPVLERKLVRQQFDSLARIYGTVSAAQKEVFENSICNFSAELYKSSEIDYSDKYESYLREIAKKIDPTFEKKVLIYKSPYPNAFTVFRGDVFLHWGLIADAESEASLAYTIGHELGHFKGAHIFKSFIQEHRSSNLNQDDAIKKWHYEQNQEYYSDSIGFVMANKAGYSWKSGLTGFYEYLSLDTILNYLGKKANVFNADGELINDIFYDESSDTLFSSHPPTESRIRMRKQMGRKVETEGENNLVSNISFLQLQNHARMQVLKSLLQKRDYKIGTIKAFKYFCLSPKNKRIKYYLLEFIRRKYLSSGAILSRTLFSDIFHFSKNKSIYDNLRWIFRNESDLLRAKDNVANLLLKHGNKYNNLLSYLEATENNEYSEFYLSLALFHHKNNVKKNYFIDKYLSKNKINFREFAIAFKKNELLFQLRGNKRKMFFYKEPVFTFRNDEGTRREYYNTGRFSGKSMKRFVEDLGHKDEYVFLDVTHLDQSEESEFISNVLIPYLYSKIHSEDLAFGLQITGSSTAYLISPELWTFLFKNNLQKVYLNSTYVFKDNTVNIWEDFKNHFSALKQDMQIMTQTYSYGVCRNSYLFQLISFNSLDFSVDEKEERVRSKLSRNDLKTEIRLHLK